MLILFTLSGTAGWGVKEGDRCCVGKESYLLFLCCVSEACPKGPFQLEDTLREEATTVALLPYPGPE